jgi:hypothetical protein
MTKYLIGLLGLALLLGGRPLVAGEAACCGAAGCQAQACNACNAGGGCCERGGCEGAACCPHCGCRLQPVCHTYCEPKTTTVHKYGCICEEICIPGVSRCGEGCGDSERCGHCGGGGNACGTCNTCQTGNNGNAGGEEGCGCHCRVREIHKLVTFPVTKCTSVKKCTVEWVCPQCGSQCACSATLENAQPAVAPQKPAVPPAPRLPVKQASNVAPLPPMPYLDR